MWGAQRLKVSLVLEARWLKWCLEYAYPMNTSNQSVSSFNQFKVLVLLLNLELFPFGSKSHFNTLNAT